VQGNCEIGTVISSSRIIKAPAKFLADPSGAPKFFVPLERGNGSAKLSTVLNVAFPAEYSLVEVTGNATMTSADARGVNMSTCYVVKHLAVISGTVLLPTEQWTLIAPGTSVRSGSIHVKDNTFTLAPGTEVAKQKKQPIVK
jgi:hypothetical protein